MTKEYAELYQEYKRRMEFAKELNQIRAAEAAIRIHRSKILGRAACILNGDPFDESINWPTDRRQLVKCYWELCNWAHELREEAQNLLKQCDLATITTKGDILYVEASLGCELGGANGKRKN